MVITFCPQRDRLKAMQKYPHLIAEAVQFTDPEREHERQWNRSTFSCSRNMVLNLKVTSLEQ